MVFDKDGQREVKWPKDWADSPKPNPPTLEDELWEPPLKARISAGVTLLFFVPFLLWLPAAIDMPSNDTYLGVLFGCWIVLAYLAGMGFAFLLALIAFVGPVDIKKRG